MLKDVFYWIFNMSLSAAMTGVLVMLVRLIKKLPRRLAVFLWIIPFARMTVPIGLNSPYSVMSLLSKIATKTIVVYQPTDKIAFSMFNSITAANTYFPITYKVNIFEGIFSVASVIWIIVCLFILLMLAVTYFSAFHEIKAATHLRDNIYLSDKITSPAVYGIIKPKIVLPAAYKDKNVELIVLHEKTHIRSFDNFWRLTAFVIVAVHWFNPLCWLFLKELLADIELSCDERVILRLGTDRAKDYASSLLESRQVTSLFASAFGGAKIRTRIEKILSFKKITWFSLTAYAALIAAVFYILLTNAG